MKSILLVLSLICMTIHVNAQYNYDNVLTYSINGTPVNGVKIKTNLPFVNSTQLPTIMIEGYAFGNAAPINLTLVYYYYENSFSTYSKVSTAGAYNPNIFLAGENGKVVIFIDSKVLFQRFHIRAFANGMAYDTATNYVGWSVVDSALLTSAVAKFQVPYENRFAGNIYMPQNGIWNTTGNVGIGTTAPGSYKLAVEGTMGARRIKVTQQATWADFVFQSEYQLPSLQEVENYINTNKHLSGIPTTEEVKKDGIDVGEMNKLLLQKVEELTLYIINEHKRNEQIEMEMKVLRDRIKSLEKSKQ